MSLTHCIIHKLWRDAPGGSVHAQAREELCAVEGSTYSLFEQLRINYRRSAQKRYGRFDPTRADAPLPGLLQQQQSGALPFTSMSKQLLEAFRIQYDPTDDPFSAHLLMAMEELLGEQWFYLFWIKHIDSLQIAGAMEAEAAQYIDTARLSYACAINLSDWQADSDEQRYLSILTSRGDKVMSDAFSQSIAFTNSVDIAAETEEFLGIVDQFTESLPEEAAQKTREQVLEYCVENNRNGEPVVMKELSLQIDDQAPEAFAQFVEEKQQQPRESFHTDRAQLKRYSRFSGRDKNLSISFSSNVFGDMIEYDEQAETLTIRQVPRTLKEQLLRAKKP